MLLVVDMAQGPVAKFLQLTGHLPLPSPGRGCSRELTVPSLATYGYGLQVRFGETEMSMAPPTGWLKDFTH